jgi:hypothetical protein
MNEAYSKVRRNEMSMSLGFKVAKSARLRRFGEFDDFDGTGLSRFLDS